MLRKVRVLLVSQTMDRGGLEQAVLTIAGGLNKERFEVHVAYFVGGAMAERLRTLPHVHAIHLMPRRRFKRFLALYRLVRELRVDLVHNHFCWYGLPAAALAGVHRLETVHNLYTWFSPTERVAFSLLSRLSDRLIAVSRAVHRFSFERFPGTRGKRWDVIYNGIDVGGPSAGTTADSSVAGIPPGAPVVGYVGRLEPEKGVGCLLDAVERVASRFPGIHLVVVGSGGLEQELKARGERMKGGRVVFTGFRTDVGPLYGLFDLLVLPSRYEGLPLSLLEGMAAGCSVVASSVGGVPEVVEDGVNGFLVPPGDAGALAEKIGLLLGDPVRRARMGEAAAATILTRFTAERMIRETEAVYEQMVAGDRGADEHD